MTAQFAVWTREAHMVNTDPQRRCYDGCNFSEREEWGAWQRLYGLLTREEAEASAESWRKYMKKERRKCEFEVREEPP